MTIAINNGYCKKLVDSIIGKKINKLKLLINLTWHPKFKLFKNILSINRNHSVL